MPRPVNVPKGRVSASSLIQASWKPDPQALVLIMKIYIVLWECKHKSHWPSEPGDVEVSHGWQLQKKKTKQNFKQVY